MVFIFPSDFQFPQSFFFHFIIIIIIIIIIIEYRIT